MIEKAGAADFFNEVVKPKSRDEETQLFGQLDKQAALIAEQLKLPPPTPEAKPNRFKLAAALTKIEAANYEQSFGTSLGDKVTAVLTEKNLRLHEAAAPPPERIETLRKDFGEKATESTLKSFSALEAETLDALLDSAAYGFDAAAVSRARQLVSTNEAAARATATLVQIAYGGQAEKFTASFKNDLTKRIYNAPTPAIDVYQDFRQFEWKRTIENFAPAVNNLAEQSKIQIKPPESDLERNKLLADFAARQLVEAYERQNSPLAKYIQNQMTAIFVQSGKLDGQQSQKETLAAQTDQNLNAPEFTHRLEASAYNLTKYDDEKKAALAVNAASQIRRAAEIKAEKQAMEMEEPQVLMMR